MRKKVQGKYVFLFLFLILFILSGCRVKRPGYVIPEDKMENILYDYHIAKAMGDNLPYNENYKKILYIEYVFKKHRITEAEFDTSLVWYTRNAGVLHKIYENLDERFKKQLDEINTLVAIRDNKPKISQPGDSIDVWIWERINYLSGSPLTNKISFVLPSDTNFDARDTLLWRANYYFLVAEPDSTEAAIMAMQIQYFNDSIINSYKKIMKSGLHEVCLQSDTLGKIKEIKGFIYYPARVDSLNTLVVNDIVLYRYHSTDSLGVSEPDSLINNSPGEEPVQSFEDIRQDNQIQEDRTEEVQPVRRTDRPRPSQRERRRE